MKDEEEEAEPQPPVEEDPYAPKHAEEIQFLREYPHLPTEIVPATRKRRQEATDKARPRVNAARPAYQNQGLPQEAADSAQNPALRQERRRRTRTHLPP